MAYARLKSTLTGLSSASSVCGPTVKRTHLGGPTTSTTARRSRTRPARLTTAQSGGISKIVDFRRLVGTATPFRDDNAHEETKGHELHVATDSSPEIIEFPGMVALWDRFWSEIPKPEFEVK